MNSQPYILLSFDAEEFDLPLEYGLDMGIGLQMETGLQGMLAVQELIEQAQVTATFFTTAFFAEYFPSLVREVGTRHEIASHAYYHSVFQPAHLLESRLKLEEISGVPVTGIRMPRMRPADPLEVKKAGYLYDASLNPTWLPGRYNHLRHSRMPQLYNGLLHLPASVTSFLRIPLFWLAFKNMPYAVFKQMALATLKKDGYLSLYFHCWEFTVLEHHWVPAYARRWCGQRLQERLLRLINDLRAAGQFISMRDWAGVQKQQVQTP